LQTTNLHADKTKVVFRKRTAYGCGCATRPVTGGRVEGEALGVEAI